MPWNTDTKAFAEVVAEFEDRLPGFWWSVGMCSVGAHASCAVDGQGDQRELLDGIVAGDPLDSGFHCDTDKGSPAEALTDVMEQALADPRVMAWKNGIASDRVVDQLVKCAKSLLSRPPELRGPFKVDEQSLKRIVNSQKDAPE